MINLRGITWDHPRGYSPLKATAEEFQFQNPQISIAWDVRSLKDFGDYPIERLVQDYDIILFDHPFTGTAVKKKILIPLDEWIPAEYLDDQEKNSVGLSNQSYLYEGQHWGLAVDAAAQVAAYRQDLLQPLGFEIPRHWNEVFEIIDRLPENTKVGLPLVPIDAVCSFISLSANIGGNNFWDRNTGIEIEIGTEALNMLRRLVPLVHPCSLEMNPIKMLDYMSNHNDIVYIPLIFGYSNYSRPSYSPSIIHFTDIPTTREIPSGSLLGGVGLGISAFSKYKIEAVEYAMYVGKGTTQRGTYFKSGGQPGYRGAWTDNEVNSQCGDFFKNTLQTLDFSYLRPRSPGYNKFQERAGEMIHQFLRLSDGDPSNLVKQLNQLYMREVNDV